MTDLHPDEARGLSIGFTDEALAKLKEVVASQPRPVAGLRLQIVGRQHGQFEHVLSLVERGKEPGEDVLLRPQGLPVPVFVDGRNSAYLDGVRIHYRYKGPDRSGLEFSNPNPLWHGEAERRIQEVLDTQLNPAIAAHGGYINLLEVNGSDAYIEMGGGCVGCGMADVTLRQGVEASIIGVVPGIERIIDRTDHASGTNPYYQPAKK
jgi:Fe/S biogenesis protein NfuA